MSQKTAASIALTPESILSSYIVSPEPIVIAMPQGGTMTFRPITTSKDRRETDARIKAAVDEVPTPETKGHSRHFIAKLPPLDREDLEFSAEIAQRATAPLVSFEQACGFHRAPALIAYLKDKLGSADKEMQILFYERLLADAEKKSPTRGSEDDSTPAGDSSPDETPEA